MTTVIKGKSFEVKQTGNKFFYFSRLTARWFPIAKSSVVFN